MLNPKEFETIKEEIEPLTLEDRVAIKRHLLILVKNRQNWCENAWLPALLSLLLIELKEDLNPKSKVDIKLKSSKPSRFVSFYQLFRKKNEQTN